MIGSIIELNMYHQGTTNAQAKAATYTTQNGQRGDNVVNYQKYLI